MRKLLLAPLTFALLFEVSCSGSPWKPALTISRAKAAPDPAAGLPKQQQQTDGLIPPEIVRSEQVQVENGVKILTMGNVQGHYHLLCNTVEESCISPMPGKDYLVFTKTTRWKFPEAQECCATLKLYQDVSITYTDKENVALVPVERSTNTFGMYWLRSWDKNN